MAILVTKRVTGQVNLGSMNDGCRSKKNIGVNIIATAALITLLITIAPIGDQSVNAQIMGDHGGNQLGNMTASQQQQHEQKMINNGTINLEQIIFQAINSRINTSLTQAMTTAERSVGNDAFAMAAFGSEEGGYFAYRIILATPGMKFYSVKVDPGNGQILETQEVSQKKLDKMHKEHSAMVVGNNGSRSSVSGFPFIIPH
jgi:uncharacterized membrane protein YkoI